MRFLLFVLAVNLLGNLQAQLNTVNFSVANIDFFYGNPRLEEMTESDVAEYLLVSNDYLYFFNSFRDSTTGNIGFKKVQAHFIIENADGQYFIDFNKTHDPSLKQSLDIFYHDFDQDGYTDLAIVNSANELITFRYLGGGRFGEGERILKLKEGDFVSQFKNQLLITTDKFIHSYLIDLEDFPEYDLHKIRKYDSDKYMCALAYEENQTITAYYLTDEGLIRSPINKNKPKLIGGVVSGEEIFIVDYNNDEVADVLLVKEGDAKGVSSDNAAFSGDPISIFTNEKLLEEFPDLSTDYLDFWECHEIDINQDKRTDLLFRGEYLIAALNDQKGGFNLVRAGEGPFDANRIFYGDLDGDSDKDFLIDSFFGIVFIEQEGDGFQPQKVFGSGYNDPQFLMDGDQDGLIDVFIISETDNQLHWMRNDEGNFLDPTLYLKH